MIFVFLMCGIAAIFAYGTRQPTDPAELGRTCNHMGCRGPDSSGIWQTLNGRLALGHRRLAIIDLSDRGAQPMEDASGSLAITFNGEIYNYRELRSALENKGHRFRSDSDTEVILELYREYGAAMLGQLRGMFAFALWDGKRGGMLLARDPFGIKPLYFADDGECIRVASEVKALLESGAVDRTPDPAGHVGFFLWGHVPEPHTFYSAIRALPAGSSMWIDDGGRQPTRLFADVSTLLRDAEREPRDIDQSDADEELANALHDSVKHHLVSDVDVGVFLSAGLDSTTLAALAVECGGRLRTVTLGFAEFKGTPYDETPIAEETARRLKTDHQTIWVRRADFEQECERFLARMDQPSTDGLNTYFVAKAAREAGLKVALSGLGGDELFGGYPSFRDVPRVVSFARSVPGGDAIGRALRRTTSSVLGRVTSPKYASVVEYGRTTAGAYFLRRGLFMPWELDGVMDAELARRGWSMLAQDERLAATIDELQSDRMKVTALEASWYMRNQLLRDADWASMSHSLEVRVPLVDWWLWKRVAPLVSNARLRVDKQAMARSVREQMPDHVLSRPKTGFFVPVRDWLLGDDRATYAGRGLRGWARFVYDDARGASPASQPTSVASSPSSPVGVSPVL